MPAAAFHLVRASPSPADADVGRLFTGLLGNKRNRSAFHSAFWFDKTEPGTKPGTKVPVPGSVPRMQTRLAQWADGLAPHKGWGEACRIFAEAERQVDKLLAARGQAQERLRRLPDAVEDERRRTEAAARIESDARATQVRLVAARTAVERARHESALAAVARDRHVAVKPGIFETVFSLGRTVREWRAALKPFDNRLHGAEAAVRLAEAHAHELEDRIRQLRFDLSAAQASQARASEDLSSLRCQIAADETKLGSGYPGGSWTGDARELHAPWLDAELDEARSDLFLAALQLHED
ncbi:MAG: hypothetical protein LBJ08_00505, partial [Bifidobacteriaceae bacterium]|nr:hypothetical protein [Bifidobacteriaceae bacterium]